MKQMGYCYYGNYAQYYEVARVETLRSLGINYKDLEELGFLLPGVVYFAKIIEEKFQNIDEIISIRN